MAETDNLVLEHLRAIRSDVAAMRETQKDHGYRLTRIEAAMAGLRRDQAADAEGAAHFESRLDRMNERMERIERRLEIAE
ncbi:MAG: hypothetical protein JWQ90_2561 [Hydrocarboniphaga sp.]|uniref:hypothetical protein n=1 Tax=Hydrocarboniphaga sp. TaxID=2033016 RepID=UPI00263314C1|nr:hypothetical protein [Hydrocarboniphaga sp.]MDB5970111.1 hypothetical protein [Hydrocarboniphaga sp.]